MSSESDGSGRSGDIIIIKQLLQKLEEAAARDAEAPREVPVGGPVVAEAAAETGSGEPPLLVLRSNRSTSSERAVSAADGEPARLQAMPEFPRTPISIELPSSDRALVTVPAEAAAQRRRPGIALAGLSFVLGIVAAGVLIVAFDPFGQRGGGTTVARAPETKVATAPVPAVEAAGAVPVSTSAASVPEAVPSANSETARPDASSVTGGSAANAAANEPLLREPVREPEQPVSKRADTAVEPSADRGRSRSEAAVPVVSPLASQSSPAAEKVELRIASRVELRAGERRSIDIRVDGPVGEVPRMLVVFRQLPEWMTFSKGGAIGNDIWLLPAPQVRDLEVEVSDGANGSAEVKVQLAKVDGSILSETTVSFVAVQMAAPSTAGLPSQVGTEATILRLQARGELLLDTGEVEAARTLLRTAAEAGSVAAALRLAETYDPAEIQRLGMGERSADVGLAVRWYEHAQALGSPVAAARLVALGRR